MLKRISKLLTLSCTVALLAGCNHTNHSGTDEHYGTFIPNDITLKEKLVNGEDLKELRDENLIYNDPGNVNWIAPRGTLTDGASVPRLVLWITDGRFKREFLKASIVHDAYSQDDNKEICPDQYQMKPWKDVHRMYYKACRAGGTSPTKAMIMFAAVWIGGPRWEDPQNDLQTASDEVLIAEFDSAKEWIEDNDPSREEVEEWIDDREPTIIMVSNLENRATSALSVGNLEAADAALRRADRFLGEALVKLPNDPVILNLKGYRHRNLAIKYRDLRMTAKESVELTKAERTFGKIISTNPRNQSALMGMSDVMILRNNTVRTEERFFLKAKDIDPNRTELMRKPMDKRLLESRPIE